ncbi:MAG: Gfo/Idh/MocA family oxidoreductase [Defluviitaleaceae bacterium]|nr:Gfo/Idh/MocA family oxidoreductase [Defluviitaleaceae bacterium]
MALNIALVGLGFGGCFAEIYKEHTDVGMLGIFDTDKQLTESFRKDLKTARVYSSLDEILKDDSIDAVHLVTPIPLHAEQTIKVLESGKHCACTVPMATSLDDIQRIFDAIKKSGKKYMMMETTLYTYQFFYVQELIKSGQLGRIQFLRGSHYQDMSDWPDYWMGLPPMHYATHAIGPLVALSGSRIKRVVCFGSGTMEPWLNKQYGNPFPFESALFEFESGLKAEATRSLFETAREYQEGMFVYGSKMCFEWGFADEDKPYVTRFLPPVKGERGLRTITEITQMPNYHHLLPEPLQRFTVGDDYDPLNPQDSLRKGAGGGHHGSHAHLVNEFVKSIVEDRQPAIDERISANITAAGICAHTSAMQNGMSIEVPDFM